MAVKSENLLVCKNHFNKVLFLKHFILMIYNKNDLLYCSDSQ